MVRGYGFCIITVVCATENKKKIYKLQHSGSWRCLQMSFLIFYYLELKHTTCKEWVYKILKVIITYVSCSSSNSPAGSPSLLLLIFLFLLKKLLTEMPLFWASFLKLNKTIYVIHKYINNNTCTTHVSHCF